MRWLSIAMLFVVGCSSEVGAPPEGAASAGVVGGEATDEFPEVARVTSGCTATLIDPRVLLTAAHCCQRPGTCTQVMLGGRRLPVERARNHPDFAITTAPDGSHGISPSFDVSLLFLRDAVRDIAPRKLASRPPLVGRPIRFIGFGCTQLGGGGSGVKRTGTNRISFFGSDVDGHDQVRFRDVFGWRSEAVDGGTPNDDANICPGDSGGPTLWQEDGESVVAGVHSLVGGSFGYSCEVASRREWILAQLGDPSASPRDDTGVTRDDTRVTPR